MIWNTKYKNKWLLTLLLVTIAFCGIYIGIRWASYQHDQIIDSVKVDELVYALINKKGSSQYAEFFVVYRQIDNEEQHVIYENDFSGLKPWKLEIADIDGDGKLEIIIAVHKPTHFDDQDKNRLFIFNYDGEKLYKKWTGSQIAGVWNDFSVGNLLSIPGDEMIFIEKVEGEGEKISIYYWFNFGFVLLAESKSYDVINDVSIIGENRIQITYEQGQKEVTLTLMVKDGNIMETIQER